MVLVASNEMESYFGDLEKRADDCYKLVSKARKAGFDPALEPEIPRAKDLAERVEAQVGPLGIASRIRAVSENNDRESTALIIAKELASELRSEGIEVALEQAVRTSLSIITEGVLVAPTEGVVRVSTMINQNNTKCAAIYYAGPIRAAGGTAQALSVLIADVVRRELGLDSYIPTPAEIERYKEEIPLYKRAVNLQYVPSSNEIEAIAKSCPICVTGESTERIEVAGNRDLPRVETNSLRGGACLVLAEGLCLKAAKILKHVDHLEISGWDFLRTYAKKKRETTSGNVKEHKYLRDVLAGRPIFAFPDEPGGFRLRYGRTRLGGLASMSIHPSTMVALDSFAAIGTQLKIQLPGKATAATPCDSIEGPSVLLKDGTFTRLDDYEKARIVADKIDRIIDLGELLVPVGEFIENNHPLEPSGWCTDWWAAVIKDSQIDAYDGEFDFASLLEFSKRHQVPLHPKYTYYWGDLDTKEINDLRNQLIRNGGKVKDNSFPLVYKEIFLRLGIFFRISDNSIVLEDGVEPLFHTLGLEVKNNSLESSMDVLDTEDSVALVSHLSGVIIKHRAPTRIGASMGRPEKAKERRMKPPPNVLFPLGEAGGSQRLVNTALKSSTNRGLSRGRPGIIEVETQLRYCKKCQKETVSIHCCKTQTMVKDQARRRSVDVSELITKAMNNTRTGILPKIKGVKGLVSDQKVPECLEKGILRAKYDLRVYKDGTLRYDMIDLPITHFYPKEIGLTVGKAKQLGYLKDINGQPLKSDDQLLEMKVQDLIVSERSGNWLVKVSNFVDEELSRLYSMEPFYGLEPNSRPEELIGNLLICLSPHTSAGVLTRLIGFTSAKAQYGHPFLHAAKRRNCDGDEDSIMLLVDGLLNYSNSFVPGTRGGTMDIPRVLSTRIDPTEIDSEAHNIELNTDYSSEFYNHAEKRSEPNAVTSLLDTVSQRLESPDQYENYGFTHKSSSINMGPVESRYVTLGSMAEKALASLELASRIRASDATYVAEQTIEKHFIRDIIGNLRSFSTQGVRCKKCPKKYRRPPLSDSCSCGGKLQLNISPASVSKYKKIATNISEKYGSRLFVKQRLELAFAAIEDTLENEQIKQMDLGAFL